MNENSDIPKRSAEHEEREVPVLIVGGGLAGLSTAFFLSWHGVKPLLVEKHSDLLIHPPRPGFYPAHGGTLSPGRTRAGNPSSVLRRG